MAGGNLDVVSAAHLDAITEIHHAFEAHGVQYWLFGGWAVDSHLGRVTREHGDIDIAVWLSDLDRIGEMIARDGWHRLTDRHADGYVAFERDGVPHRDGIPRARRQWRHLHALRWWTR